MNDDLTNALLECLELSQINLARLDNVSNTVTDQIGTLSLALGSLTDLLIDKRVITKDELFNKSVHLNEKFTNEVL